MNAYIERQAKRSLDLSQRMIAEWEQGRSKREFLERQDHFPKEELNRVVVRKKANKEMEDDMAGLYVYESYEGERAYHGDEPEPQTQPWKSLIHEDLFRKAKRRVKIRTIPREADQQETADSSTDEETSQQPASPESSHVTSKDELEPPRRPNQIGPARLAEIRMEFRDSRQESASQETPNGSSDGESSEQSASSMASSNTSEDEPEPRARPNQIDPAKLAAIRRRFRDAGEQNAPQKTANSPANGEASQQRTTPQKTRRSPTNGEATRQQTTPQETPNRPTHGRASQQPTPAASNAICEHNPFVSQGPMTFNLPGRDLEDLRPQRVLGQLAASRHAMGTNTPKPSAPITPQPSTVVAGTPNADEHKPFTGRRGPPPFGNLANPGLEGFNARNLLGQGSGAVPANRRLPPALADMNEAVARFEAYREPPPTPPEGSSEDEFDEEEDDDDGSPGRDRNGDWGQASNRDIPRVRLFSPTASPKGSDHNGDARRDSYEYRLVHPDRRGPVDADYDSDSTLSELVEGELHRRMALHQLGAGHDSDEDDEESHILNYGGRDPDYEASPPRRNGMPEARRRRLDSPLRLGNHRVVEPPRTPDASQILRGITSPLLPGSDGGLRLGNHEVVAPAGNPFLRPPNNHFGLGNPEAGVANNPFGLGNDQARSINERDAAFTRDFARDDLGFREKRKVMPPEGPRATLIRHAEGYLGTPIAWKVSPWVVKRVPQRAGPRSQGLIRNIPRGDNRRNKPERSGTEPSASRSRVGSGPRTPPPEHLTRPLQRAFEEQVERHAERNSFTPPSPQPAPSPQPESPQEQWKPERNDERENEDDEMCRLMAEVMELDEADHELFRDVMLETGARADAELEISGFFAPLAGYLGGRRQERRGSYKRCAPNIETTPDTETSTDVESQPTTGRPTPSDPITEDSPQTRSRHTRPRPANITYPFRPFSNLRPTARRSGPLSPRPYSPRETKTQAILRFPERLACEIGNGNIDGWMLLCQVLMVLILTWISFVIVMGSGEDHEVHWYVARGGPRVWLAGS